MLLKVSHNKDLGDEMQEVAIHILREYFPDDAGVFLFFPRIVFCLIPKCDSDVVRCFVVVVISCSTQELGRLCANSVTSFALAHATSAIN